MYKISSGGAVMRVQDFAFIPSDLQNLDFIAYQEWLSTGGVPESADPAPVIYPKFLVRDFLALFTRGEKLAVKAATRVSDEVGLWYDEMLAAQYITAEDPDTLAGLGALVTAGLLTAARHDEILASMQPVIA